MMRCMTDFFLLIKQPSFSTWSSYTKTYALTAPLRTLLTQMKSMSMNKLESSGFVLNLAFFKASRILKISCKAWCKSINFSSDRLKYLAKFLAKVQNFWSINLRITSKKSSNAVLFLWSTSQLTHSMKCL